MMTLPSAAERDTAAEPLINPMKGRHSPDVGPTAILVATAPDLKNLCQLLGFKAADGRPFFNSRLFVESPQFNGISVAGPFTGAPHAVILLENLIAWGARRVIFLGWCGSMSTHISIGDLVLPGGAIADEGTSRHYIEETIDLAYPSSSLQAQLRQVLKAGSRTFHEGWIWSMDAIYRETPQKIALMQQRQAVAVEMELSAVFNVAALRRVEAGALLVVSDELASLKWNPGFGSQCFKQSRKAACEVISVLCRKLSPPKLSKP